jgi:hypothetical protein
MSKAKYILMAEVRKLRYKASQKKRDAERLENEADELEKKANESDNA